MIAAWLDLEVASGNDAIASHSAIRKTAKLMGQFLPGTDFVTSGYSVMPRHDNTFGGGNYDADDLDEWLTIQRDWQVDGGIEPVGEAEVTRVRERAARAVQAVFAELGLPPVTDAEVEAATTGYDAADMPDRDRAADVEAADAALERKVSGLDVALALDRRGFGDIARADRRHAAPACVGRLPADVGGDRRRRGRSLRRQRPEPVHGARHRLPARRAHAGRRCRRSRTWSTRPRWGPERGDPGEIVEVVGEAVAGTDPAEVVIAVGPAFADTIRETINGLDHGDVLAAILDGAAEAGAVPRIVRVRRVADVAFIAHDGARLSGSGIALGIQSKGTAVIHRADLQPLDNLELFGMSPLYSLESYRAMGRNAAGYALGKRVGPVPTELDNFARAKLIVRTTLLHARETRAVVRGAAPLELELVGGRRSSGRDPVGPPAAGAPAARARPRPPRGTAARAATRSTAKKIERLLGRHQDAAEVLVLGRRDAPEPLGQALVVAVERRREGEREPEERRDDEGGEDVGDPAERRHGARRVAEHRPPEEQADRDHEQVLDVEQHGLRSAAS